MYVIFIVYSSVLKNYEKWFSIVKPGGLKNFSDKSPELQTVSAVSN